MYNHLQERIKLPFSYENYLDSIYFLLQIIVSLFWKKETFRKVLNIESLRFMEIKECPNIKKREKRGKRQQGTTT